MCQSLWQVVGINEEEKNSHAHLSWIYMSTTKWNTKVNMQLWNLRGAMKELWIHPSFHHFSSGRGGTFVYSVSTSAPWDSSVWLWIIISQDYPQLMWHLCHQWGSQGPPGLVLASWDSAAWPHNLPSFTRNVFLLALYPLVQILLIFLASVQAPLSPPQTFLNFSLHLGYLLALPWYLMAFVLMCYSEDSSPFFWCDIVICTSILGLTYFFPPWILFISISNGTRHSQHTITFVESMPQYSPTYFYKVLIYII